MKKRDEGADLSCSFCGKSQKEVKKLIAGPTVYICDECVELCREIIVEGLNSLPGFRCVDPRGAFYAFPRIAETGLSSAEFEDRALSEAGVALLSGSAFGEYGEGYVRLSYANSQENIQKAVDRLDRLVRGL